MPYGPLVHLEKEECVSHIAKRMGTGLREIVKRWEDNFNIFSSYAFFLHGGLISM